ASDEEPEVPLMTDNLIRIKIYQLVYQVYTKSQKTKGLPFGNPLIIWRKRRDSNSGTLSGRRFSRPKKNK
ncbi:hypothetical protein, partial [Escherichia coli]